MPVPMTPVARRYHAMMTLPEESMIWGQETVKEINAQLSQSGYPPLTQSCTPPIKHDGIPYSSSTILVGGRQTGPYCSVTLNPPEHDSVYIGLGLEEFGDYTVDISQSMDISQDMPMRSVKEDCQIAYAESTVTLRNCILSTTPSHDSTSTVSLPQISPAQVSPPQVSPPQKPYPSVGQPRHSVTRTVKGQDQPSIQLNEMFTDSMAHISHQSAAPLPSSRAATPYPKTFFDPPTPDLRTQTPAPKMPFLDRVRNFQPYDPARKKAASIRKIKVLAGSFKRQIASVVNRTRVKLHIGTGRGSQLLRQNIPYLPSWNNSVLNITALDVAQTISSPRVSNQSRKENDAASDPIVPEGANRTSYICHNPHCLYHRIRQPEMAVVSVLGKPVEHNSTDITAPPYAEFLAGLNRALNISGAHVHPTIGGEAAILSNIQESEKDEGISGLWG